jgi:hypothetical protein
MNPATQSTTPLVARLQERLVKVGIGYCIVSIITLPLANLVWIGELPLLAVVQVPKLAVTGWLRKHVVMEAIKAMGLSKGSFSPDYIMARPFGLGLAYSIPIILVSLSLLLPGCASSSHRRLAIIFIAALLIDGLVTYFLADRHSLSMY